MQNTHDIISELRQARATQKKQSTLTIKQQCNPENSRTEFMKIQVEEGLERELPRQEG